MSITDELREFINQTCWATTSKAKWLAIADRIDEKHYDVQKDAYSDGANYVFKNPTLFGLMRLPKVANNEIVNVGDKLDGYNKTIEVMWLRLGRTGWWIIDKYGKSYACCDAFLHHHEPTVEDVLREFGDKYCDMVAGSDKESELFAEYAAKLQLRGDGE